MPVTPGSSGESGALGGGSGALTDPSAWVCDEGRLVLCRMGCLGEKEKRTVLLHRE